MSGHVRLLVYMRDGVGMGDTKSTLLIHRAGPTNS